MQNAFTLLDTGLNKYIYLTKSNKISIISDAIFDRMKFLYDQRYYYETLNILRKDIDIKPEKYIDELFYNDKESCYMQEIGMFAFKQESKSLNEPYEITVEVTSNCNFNCKYCNSSDNTQNSINVKKLLSYFDVLKKEVNEIILNFYGGEPSLYIDKITEICNYAKKNFAVSSYNITTNLYNLTDKFIKLINKYDMHILVSFDGYRDCHNQGRVTTENKVTHSIVYKNLVKLLAFHHNPFHVKINSVINPYTDYYELSKYFTDFMVKYNLDESQFSASYISNVSESRFTDDELNRYEARYTKLINNLYEYINNDRSLYHLPKILWRSKVKQIYSYLYDENIKINKERVINCEVGRDRVFINSDGTFKVCNQYSNTYNNFNIGTCSLGCKISGIKKFHKAHSKITQKCSSCWIKDFCQACYVHAVCIDNHYFVPEEFCRTERELVYGLLLAIVKFGEKMSEGKLKKYFKL